MSELGDAVGNLSTGFGGLGKRCQALAVNLVNSVVYLVD